MSAQTLNIMLSDLFRSEEALGQYQQDPDTVSAKYGLSDEERDKLKAKDMGWLYVQGVHPYILAQYAFSLHLDIGQYLQQVQQATGYKAPAAH
jgi:hypothetical protein